MNIREIIEIRDKLKNDLAVVEKFLVIAKKHGLTDGEKTALSRELPSASEQPVLPELNGDYGSIGKAVTEAIKLCPSDFTVTDVDEALRKDIHHPLTRLQISTVLARLQKQQEIKVVEKKRGRKAAIYRKT